MYIYAPTWYKGIEPFASYPASTPLIHYALLITKLGAALLLGWALEARGSEWPDLANWRPRLAAIGRIRSRMTRFYRFEKNKNPRLPADILLDLAAANWTKPSTDQIYPKAAKSGQQQLDLAAKLDAIVGPGQLAIGFRGPQVELDSTASFGARSAM